MDSAIEMKEVCWKIAVWQMNWLSVILLVNNVLEDFIISGQVLETE